MQSKLNLRALIYCTSLMIYNYLYREMLDTFVCLAC